MKTLYWALIAGIAIMMAFCTAYASVLNDTRYCGDPKRDKDGQIIRRADVIAAFKKEHPCPVNGKKTGACGGWNIDHVIPLACGGCDSVANMQWLPVEMKRCRGNLCKDRWERKIYCGR